MALTQFITARAERIAGWREEIMRVTKAYWAAHRRLPNLLAPRRFSEKMQWRKLFDLNPEFTVLSDKLAVRSFIAARIGEEFLIPLLWSGLPEDIPFDRLEPPYVLKSTHASGHVIMVNPGEPIDRVEIRRQAAAWLAFRHGAESGEPAYTHVPPRLMIERTMTTAAGAAPEEVRLFVFDGKVAVLNTVIVEAGKIRNGAFHTPGWTRLDWHFSRWLDRPFPPPQRLADMIRAAERLGAGFDHGRVDFYDCGEKIHVGEITVYAWSGLACFNPDSADFLLGKYWRLRRPLRRAAKAVLLGQR
jgi:hypothetical protein